MRGSRSQTLEIAVHGRYIFQRCRAATQMLTRTRKQPWSECMNSQDIGACDLEVIIENTSELYYNITMLESDPGRILQVNLKPSRALNKYRAQYTPTLEPLKLP